MPLGTHTHRTDSAWRWLQAAVGSLRGRWGLAALLLAGSHALTSAAETPPAAAAACPACASADDHLGDDPWIAPAARVACPVLGLPVSDQDPSVRQWRDLDGQPLVVAFIYSRCGNPSKCPRTTAAVGSLARRAASEHLGGVRFAIATYDPGYDTTARLAQWAQHQGIAPELGVALLRPAPAALAATVSGWQLGVNYQADGEVATHDIELLVCDRHLRLAHRYHATIWDQDAVLADLRRLLAEPDAAAPPPPPAARSAPAAVHP